MKIKKTFKISYLIPFLFIIIFIGIAFLLFYEKDCGSSKECFDQSFNLCEKAKVLLEENQNIFEYKIIGSKSDNCLLKITITQVDPNSKKESISSFEGKYMTCEIPKNQILETESILNYESDNILKSCTGPLKEAIYELIIQKMYNVLAENLGDIISQAQE